MQQKINWDVMALRVVFVNNRRNSTRKKTNCYFNKKFFSNDTRLMTHFDTTETFWREEWDKSFVPADTSFVPERNSYFVTKKS